MSKLSKSNNVIGFDFGTSFIGVALGNLVLRQARPLMTIERKSNVYYWHKINQLMLKWQPEIAVVGKPLTLDGKAQEMTRLADRFGNQLQGRYQIKVFTEDERLTTRLAQDIIHDSSAAKSKQLIDKIAAKIILQAWFDKNETY